ncbi:MAG: DUF4342 domain-containing protein [Tissierellia bacterium]|nr:DUF4342 domain-containing protein [Tissierellia bacterium]
MVTLEQVEKLRQYASISYEEAKAALEETNGDILEAIVNLEKQNKINGPKEGGYYNSSAKNEESQENSTKETYKAEHSKKEGSSFRELTGKFFKWCGNILNKGNRNILEVVKGNQKVMSVPVTVLAVLMIFTFWITIPLLVVGLFFGYRYKVIGPDLGKDNVNRAMDSVADAAENIKREVKGEMNNEKDSNS